MIRPAAAVLALILVFPALASTQEVEERTHTVERGTTLWALAQAFYGDPYEWTRIFEANRDRVEDPDLLEPGLVLRIPEEPAAFAGGIRPAEAGEGDDVAGDEADPPAGTVRGVAVVPGARSAVPTRPARGTRPARAGRTTFYPGPPPEVRSLKAPDEVLAFSEDDFHRAYWLITRDGDRGHTGTVQAVVSENEARPWARPFDEVRLVLDGAVPAVGARLQTFRIERTIEGLGRVAVPTGTLVVKERGPDGVLAGVDDVYARLARGDLVRPLPTFPLTPEMVSRPARTPARTTVVGFPEAQGLHGTGDYLFLGDGSAEGIRVGDVFEVAPDDGSPGEAPGGGRVQVVSVHEGYSTALIVDLENPVFETGVVLRLSRRMQ